MTDSPVPVEAPYEERSPFSPVGDAPLLERFPIVRAAVEYFIANDVGT